MSLDEVRGYDEAPVGKLEEILGADLVGVYVSGSIALGDYVPGRSDLDRFVVAAPLPRETKVNVIAAARHESLPCPARGLELVVYGAEVVARPPRGADFELNLNSGSAMPFHASLDPTEEPAHWFVLDRAIVRERGFALVGPPPAEVFASVPRGTALDALADALRWHRENARIAGPNLVLNALRAWRFVREDDWVSKDEAAAWARREGADGALVDAALAARTGAVGPLLDVSAALALLARVLMDVERERARIVAP